MADETSILEPMTDNHETHEMPDTPADTPVETVVTETETETEPTETAAAEVVAAIDAFLTEPQDVHEAEAKIEAAEEVAEGAVPEVEAEDEAEADIEADAEAEPEAEVEAEAEIPEEVEVLEETEHTEQTEEAEAPADSSEHEHSSLLENAEPEHEEEENREEDEEHSHIEEHSVLDEHSHLDQSEHSEHLQEEESFSHDEHSHLDHSEADHSFGESADAHSERTGSALSHHEEESHYRYQGLDEHEHEMSLHESEQDHDDYAVEEHDELEANEETVSAHDRLQQALADVDATPTVDTRRESTSSSRSGGSGGSGRRTSMRTEALIQAAARAVVAKINGVEAEGADFDILSSITESQAPSKGRQSVARSESRSVRSGAHSSAATHSTSNEEADYEHERDMGDDDDVFSNRSHRSSLGSFEHHSGASHTGSDYDHKKDITAHSMAGEIDAHDSETEHEEDYEAETGSVSYHEEHRSRSPRMSTMSTMSKGPRISDVTGISRMSQYDPHHRDHDESYQDNDDYIPHTIRGAPRPAFRTPSSVRAIQMSSPSPSVIFGVSPRSAARRRRVGTGEGVDDGQSMGSVATYSSLPNSPSKRGTPTRFKVFQRPEPAPLVLLHATIMPTRWGWSDVLRNFDEMMSHSPSKRISESKEELHVDEVPADLASFEPSAALKRLHNTWCQLQEYSLGADTVTERGVLLPHPQNDYEVLEERLLEALELPVRRRARILECGHYLGPADVDDDDNEDYDYYDDENDNDDDEDSPNKRHWCTACRSEIRYESLGAERIFRVKVYASNGLMTVGAWDACWREMERVDVEIEPIVADPALQRELNLLRTLQQQEVYRRELELEEEMRAMQQEKEEEEQQHEMASEHDEHQEHHGEHPEHDVHVDTEHQSTRGSVDQFYHVAPSPTPVSPPLRDSPVEPPATASTDHAHDHEADYRRRAAEDRLREIYGSTPPHASSRTMSLPPQMESTPAMSATPGTALAMTHHSMHTQHSAYGPSPPSPSAEAYERREERRYRQYSYPGPDQADRADRGFEYGGPAPAFPPPPTSRHGNYNHGHPQHPYEAASFPELLMAAVKVFLRDRKHVAITVLSVIVIVLATLRTPAADTTTAPIINTPAPVQAVVQQPVVEAYQPVPVAITTATVFHTVVEELAASVVAKVNTHVETVVEKMTVKVYETVTEVATETSTETATTTATQAATTVTAETVAESIESTAVEVEEAPEATEVVSVEEPQETTETVEATEDVVAEAEPTPSAYEVVSVEEPQETVEPEAPSSSVAVELPMESADAEPAPVEEEVEEEAHDEL